MIAIVIPYFKRTYFEDTLKSLADQTDKRFRVYLGNDASPDDPAELIEKYKEEFDLTYVAFDRNLGGQSLVGQWDRCLAMTGDERWLMILGDDDVLGRNCIAEFYAQLEDIESVASVVRFATVKIDGNNNETSAVYQNPKLERAPDFLFNKQRSSLSEYIFRMDKVRTIGFKRFPLAWHSDVLGVLEFSDFNTLYSINEANVYVRTSEINISGRSDNHKPKADATFQFYHYLLSNHEKQFTKTQRAQLLQLLAKSYLSNKKNPANFFTLTKHYVKRCHLAAYVKFLKTFFVRSLQSR